MNFFRAGYPVAEKALWDPFQEGEDVNRWSSAEFIYPRPDLCSLDEFSRMGCVDRGRTNAID